MDKFEAKYEILEREIMALQAQIDAVTLRIAALKQYESHTCKIDCTDESPSCELGNVLWRVVKL